MIGFKGQPHAALEALTLLGKFSHGPGSDIDLLSMRIAAAATPGVKRIDSFFLVGRATPQQFDLGLPFVKINGTHHRVKAPVRQKTLPRLPL
jgi:hypothetical protein